MIEQLPIDLYSKKRTQIVFCLLTKHIFVINVYSKIFERQIQPNLAVFCEFGFNFDIFLFHFKRKVCH